MIGCSSRRSDIEATCSLGASELTGGHATPDVVQRCTNVDEKILDSLPEQQHHHQTEDCLACIALAGDPAVVCFLDCHDGVCDHLDVATCQAHCANSGVDQLCALGGLPAKATAP